MASVLFRAKHLSGVFSVFTKLLMICLAERRASSACGTSAESKHPEDVSFTVLFQGVLSKKPFLSNHLVPRDKKSRGSFGEIP